MVSCTYDMRQSLSRSLHSFKLNYYAFKALSIQKSFLKCVCISIVSVAKIYDENEHHDIVGQE